MLEQLLFLGPFWTIALISLVVSVIVTLIYKYTTNQTTLKGIKSEIDKLRKEIKTAKEPGKMAEINSKLMQKTMEQFRASLKPMIITMIPALIILGWMQSTVAFQQLYPNEEFNTSAMFEKTAQGEIEIAVPAGLELLSPANQKAAEKVAWTLKGPEGNYELEYRYNNEVYTKNIIITNKWQVKNPTLQKEQSFLGIKTSSGSDYPIRKDSKINAIKIENKPIHPLGTLNLFGWEPGWLATYIILSLVFSMALRALLKVQ